MRGIRQELVAGNNSREAATSRSQERGETKIVAFNYRRR
jgi:hypothetical protein